MVIRIVVATLGVLAAVGIIGCSLFIAYQLGQVKVHLDNLVKILTDQKEVR
jgi:hypothetical protein